MTAMNAFWAGAMAYVVIFGMIAVTNGISRAVIGESWTAKVGSTVGQFNPLN